jgi:hypothetical protein
MELLIMKKFKTLVRHICLNSRLLTLLLVLAILAGVAVKVSAVSGTKTVCPSGCDYTTLTAAFSDLQTNGVTGATVLELQSSYDSTSETFPITIGNVPGNSSVNSITVRPASGATNLSISSASTTATIDLNGAQNVIFDGQPGGTGGTKQLTIEDTSTSGIAIRFINDASNNTVKYCTVKGVNTSATSGVIVFSTGSTTGSDSNAIDNCDIRDGASTPANGIYSAGTTSSLARNNSGNTVSNNNIFNFFMANADSSGIKLEGGNNSWTISSNNFYQTASRTTTANSTTARGIYINNNAANGINFAVADNSIGGGAAGAGGTAWTVAGNFSNTFVGVHLNVGTSTPSSVQGNVIKNFSWASSSTSSASSGVWSGIYIQNGGVSVGTATGNTVGSGTGTSSITLTASGSDGTVYGMVSDSPGTVTISNNTVGSIRTTGTTSSIRSNITGIQVTNGTNTISNNLVGSTTTSNSLFVNNAVNTSTANGESVTGILSSSTTSAGITNNTIANLTNFYTGTNTSGLTRGIAASAGGNSITGNTIRNLSGFASHNGGFPSGPVVGIIVNTTSTSGQTIGQNVIHTLTNNGTSCGVTGIHTLLSSAGTNLISRNFVHSLNVTGASGNFMQGIRVQVGTATVQNNLVRLGIDAGGNSITTAIGILGIYDDSSLSQGSNFYFNNVYIGGTGVSNASADTRAFGRGGPPASGASNIRNNIFANVRNNATTGGKHFAYALFTNANSLTSDYNLYYASGTGAVLATIAGIDRASLSDIQTGTGQDANSKVGDPLFVNPNGTSATVNLHLSSIASPAANSGTSISGINTDFDGDTRDATAPDIGADEIISAQFSSATYSVNEGAGSATITVSRTAGSVSGATVNYSTSNNTATGGASCTGGADYVNSSGTLTFAAGETSKTFNVPICDDAVYEGNELVNLTLSNATGDAIVGTPSTAVLTIVENDAEPQPDITITDVSQSEGNSGTTNFNFTVNLSSTYSQPITVNYSTADGTATAGSDYTACSGCNVIIAAGQTSGTITVPVSGDTQFEGNETFFVNLTSASAGNITDSQGQGTITNDDSVVGPTNVIITEFRLRGPNGENDEFIELYNNTDSDIVVGDANPVTCALQVITVGPAVQCGWAIVDLQGGVSNIPRAIIPVGQTIAARGHYLVANEGTIPSPGYSLGAYATPDLTYAPVAYGDADYTGLVLYRTADRAQFNSGNKLDAVGFDGVALPYREGDGLLPSTGVSENAEHSFVRRIDTDLPVDTGDNRKDFNFVSTGGTILSGKLPLLGAPGPQGKTSAKRDAGISGGLVPGVPDRIVTAGNLGALAPNGILTFQRRYVNNTGQPISRLRFRVYDITTLNSPDVRALYGSTSTRQAILRVLDRASATVIVNGQTLQGLVLEQPPTQTAQGGGVNSSLVVDTVLPSSMLPNGGTVDVQFRLGIEGGGYYRFFVIFEALR